MCNSFEDYKMDEFHSIFDHLSKGVKVISKNNNEYLLKKKNHKIKVEKIVQLTLFGEDELLYLVNELTVMNSYKLLSYLCPRKAKKVFSQAV